MLRVRAANQDQKNNGKYQPVRRCHTGAAPPCRENAFECRQVTYGQVLFHNGRFHSLQEALRFCVRREDIDDVIAFLQTLTDRDAEPAAYR
jgi:cytochrome c peroxidase